MASAPALRSTLSDEEFQNLVALTKDVDSIELKLTVPEGAQLHAIRALGLDPLQAQIRQVFFFDTPDLALDGHGVVVRARRSQKKGDDSVVKLRPVVPSELPQRAPPFAELRHRARRVAPGLRRLGVVQGRSGGGLGPRGNGRPEEDPQAVLEGAAGAVRRARAGGRRARRPVRARPALLPEAEVGRRRDTTAGS